MTEREALVAFNLVPDIGSVKAAALAAQAGGSYAEAWSLFPSKVDWKGESVDWEGEMTRAARQRVTIVTQVDAAYPQRLRDLASPPLVLYAVGDVSTLAKPAVALVGTRLCTPYGTAVAERFATALARAGWVVVSGLAQGIDAAAHRGALAGDGATVGVLGGALDQFFPAENRGLAREMTSRKGCVVTEFPFGRKPDRTTFPQRNRIVAALASGVVAVESPLHSGTLITVTQGMDLHRAIMAVPGRIDSAASAGCNRLIREGARAVTSVDDIVEELNPLFKTQLAPVARAHRVHTAAPSAAAPKPVPKPPPEVQLTLEEDLVLRHVTEELSPVDGVIRASGLPAAKVNAILVALRLKRKVRFAPGNRVSRA